MSSRIVAGAAKIMLGGLRVSDIGARLTSIVAAERWAELAGLLDDRFFRLLLEDRESVTNALAAAPADWLRANPRYLLMRSIAANIGSALVLVEDDVFSVFQDWVRKQDRPLTRDQVAMLLAPLRHQLATGQITAAAEAASAAMSAIEGAPESSGFQDVLPPALIRAGMAKLLAGGLVDAIAAFAEAERWSRGRGENPYRHLALRHLALARALSGGYAAAARDLDAGSDGGPQDVLAYAQALIALGRLDQATVERWLPVLEDARPDTELAWLRVHIAAKHALYWGDRDRVIHEIEDYLITHGAVTRPGCLAGDQLRADLADLYQALGNLGAAEHVLDDAGLDGRQRAVLTSRARLELLRGDRDAAMAQLAEAERTTGGRVHFEPAWRVLQAMAGCSARAASAARGTVRSLALAIEYAGAYDALVEGGHEVRAELARHLVAAPATVPMPFRPPTPVVLTAREREVLTALRAHDSVKEMAAALHVSPNTAKTHLRVLYRKLGVHGRDEALRLTAPIRR